LWCVYIYIGSAEEAQETTKEQPKEGETSVPVEKNGELTAEHTQPCKAILE
jgi:hypothetical protein